MKPFAVHPGKRVLVKCPACKGSGTIEFETTRTGPAALTLPCEVCRGKRVLWACPASEILFEGKVLPKGWRNVFAEKMAAHRSPQFAWIKWAEFLSTDRAVVLGDRVRVVGVGDKVQKWRVDSWDGSSWVKIRREDTGKTWLTMSFTRALARGREVHLSLEDVS